MVIIKSESDIKMRFIVKQASGRSERLGVLTGFVETPNAVIETPACALLTQVSCFPRPFRLLH